MYGRPFKGSDEPAAQRESHQLGRRQSQHRRLPHSVEKFPPCPPTDSLGQQWIPSRFNRVQISAQRSWMASCGSIQSIGKLFQRESLP